MSHLSQTAPSAILEALGEYAADTSALAIAQLDEQRHIVSVNKPLERLAGTALAGRPVYELVTPAQRDTLDQALDAAKGGWHQRLLGLFPDDRGIPLDFAVSFRPLGSGWLLIAEQVAATVSAVNEQLMTLNDELARAQRQIRHQNAELARQNDKLRELDQLKDALLANVSHDLRTPLTAILGYAELLRRRGDLSDKQAQATEVIERNARRLLLLVNDLLLLGQARAGQLTLEREPVDLYQLAADAIELARPLAAQAQLNIELETQPDSTTVTGDRLRLAQLLDNLIANAIKFTPTGGTVTIRVHHDPQSASIEIEDDGPGIPENKHEKLYEAFVRGSATDIPGTGLGLAIVRTVADAHQATINLETKPGSGTRFTITLPRQHRSGQHESPS